MKGYPELSIIIPALNEEKYIGNLLNDIKKSVFKNYEVYVVDNGSKDNTSKIVLSYNKEDRRFNLIKTNKKGVSLARNLGASKAKGNYLLFLDADSRIPMNYLTLTLNEMKERRLDLASHYMTSAEEVKRKLDEGFWFVVNNFVLKPTEIICPSVPGCGGPLIKRTLHHQINGYDETIKTVGEDVHYLRKGAKLGKFRILNSVKTGVDMRRFNKEGRLKVWGKWMKAFYYNLFRKDFKKFDTEYKFGEY